MSRLGFGEFWRRRKRKNKPRKGEVVAVMNQHELFAQRFNRYLVEKIRLMKQMPFSRQDRQFINEAARMFFVGRATYQTSVLSRQAAERVLDFLERNKEYIIDLFIDKDVAKGMPRSKAAASAIDFFEFNVNGIKKNLNNVPNGEFNEGVVERADVLLFGKDSGTQRVFVPRLVLMGLMEFEKMVAKRALGKRFDEYSEADIKISKSIFSDNQELII